MESGRTSLSMLAVLLSAVLWGFIGLFTRNLSSEGFSTIQVTLLRMLIALAILGAAMLIFDRKSFRIHAKDLWIFVVFAVFKILSDLFLFEAQTKIHLSLSTVLQLTSPYYVLIFSVFLFGERITAKKLIAIFIGFVGCVFVTGILSDEISFDVLGIMLAIGSGIAYAAYTVGTKLLLNRGYSANAILLYIFLISTVICLPIADIPSIPSKIDGFEPVLNLIAMGFLMTLVPYYLQAFALRSLDAVKVNIIGLVEVVSAVIVGWVFYNESLGWLNFIGMVLIPLSIVIMNVDIALRRKDTGEV